MDLQTRLEILCSTGTISNETREVMLNVIKMFQEKHQITLTEENGAMMTNHLSMDITRVKNNEPVKVINEEVYQEILESEFLEKAQEIYKDLESVLDVKLPEDEKKYMLVNICTILDIINNCLLKCLKKV